MSVSQQVAREILEWWALHPMIFSACLAAALILFFCTCSRADWFNNKIEDHEKRLKALEKK